MNDAAVPKAETDEMRHDEAEAQPRSPRHAGWVWLVTFAAIAVVGYMMFTHFRDRGPFITVTFETADGLEVNRTKVKYRAVTLGVVEEIELSEDSSHVIVGIRMSDDVEPMLTEDTRFWVVRPRLGSGVRAFQAGLETLVSGVYVAMDPGSEEGAQRDRFEGLEAPPSVRSDEPGTVYFLTAESLGGLGRGAPLFHRDVEVGEVLSQELHENAVELRVFVRAPYDADVTPQTRFWNTSGLRVGTGADGLRVELESVMSLLSGGVSFSTPVWAKDEPAAPAESRFHLHASRPQAEMDFYRTSYAYVSYFQGSVRGLSPGSEVRMFGCRVGTVTEVGLVHAVRPEARGELAARVAFVLQPERALQSGELSALDHEAMRELVADQLRVVLKTDSFLTGEKVLSLEYMPRASTPPGLELEGDALVLPSETLDLQQLTATATRIAAEIESIPFAEIGSSLRRSAGHIEATVGSPELRDAIASLETTLDEVSSLAEAGREGLGPLLERLPTIADKLEGAVDRALHAFGRNGYGADSDVSRGMRRALDQTASAARSIRLLANYLNRHPEALITGREGEHQ